MQTLQAAQLKNTNSNVFYTEMATKCWVRLGGTFSSQTVTMEESTDNSTFATFTTDATNQAFTVPTYKLYDLPGGIYFRFAVSNGGTPSIDSAVAGTGVKLV